MAAESRRYVWQVKGKLQQLRDERLVAEREQRSSGVLGHFIFTGSPGTGKTTVARVMAKVLNRLKLLTCNKLVETSGLSMTGQFVGQTKTKVAELLKKAKGGVLFIDEAYELGKGQFGTEACTALVEAMTQEEHRGTVVVIAGYREDIDKMLDTNSGLKSRFTHSLEFPDWDAEDCVSFLKQRAEQQRFQVAEPAWDALRRAFEALKSCEGWGNARDCGKVWDAVMTKRAKRVVDKGELDKTISKEDAQVCCFVTICVNVCVILRWMVVFG